MFKDFSLSIIFTNFGENHSGMVKVLNSTNNIQAFGGLNFVSDHFDKEGISVLIDSELGHRSLLATYSYADVIKNMWMLNFCGGECAEDIQTHFKAT